MAEGEVPDVRTPAAPVNMLPDLIAFGFVLLGLICLYLADWKPEGRR